MSSQTMPVPFGKTAGGIAKKPGHERHEIGAETTLIIVPPADIPGIDRGEPERIRYEET